MRRIHFFVVFSSLSFSRMPVSVVEAEALCEPPMLWPQIEVRLAGRGSGEQQQLSVPLFPSDLPSIFNLSCPCLIPGREPPYSHLLFLPGPKERLVSNHPALAFHSFADYSSAGLSLCVGWKAREGNHYHAAAGPAASHCFRKTLTQSQSGGKMFGCIWSGNLLQSANMVVSASIAVINHAVSAEKGN
jgi:hypothetical protein